MTIEKIVSNNRILVVLILLGSAIRLLLIPLPGFKIDVGDWFAWTIRLNEVGYSKFYSTQVFSDYTPGYMYVLGLLGIIKNVFQINDVGFYILLKLPAVFIDIALGVLIYTITINSSKFYRLLAASLIFLNPALIFNSSIWGQIDSILAFFILLTIYYLKKEALILSSLTLGLAFIIKPQTIAIFPVFAFFLMKSFNVKKFLKLSLPFLSIILILSFPFFQNNALIQLINLIFNTSKQYPYTSLFAYNFWGFISFWINDGTIWNGLSYQLWGYILFGIYWLMLSYFYFKKNLSLYTLSALALLGFYFLPTRVHERYLYPALVFLIVLIGINRSKVLFIF